MCVGFAVLVVTAVFLSSVPHFSDDGSSAQEIKVWVVGNQSANESVGSNYTVVGKKLVVTGGGVILDNRTLPPVEVAVRVKGRLIRILPAGNEVVFQDVVNVTTDGLIYEDGVLKTFMGKVIEILPSEILDKIRGERSEIKELRLENQFAPRYRARIVEKRWLLGIIPWDLEVVRTIDAQTGKLLEENKPWWSFLLF